MTPDTRLSIRVTPEYLHDVKLFALMEHKTVTQIVMEAIEEYTKARDYTIKAEGTAPSPD